MESHNGEVQTYITSIVSKVQSLLPLMMEEAIRIEEMSPLVSMNGKNEQGRGNMV